MPHHSCLTGGINGHFAFIEGPRLCVGYRLGEDLDKPTRKLDLIDCLGVAVFEMKAILAELIKRYDFAEVPGEEVDVKLSFTLQPYLSGREHEGSQAPLLVRPLE